VATVWQRHIKGCTYEVRSAGNSLRLYTDGVFHTQFNPERLVSGGVWDLLALPALLHPEQSIRRVLVLGVGGGAAIHLIKALVSPESLVGVELNPVHVQIMQRFFGLKNLGSGVEIVVADAIQLVKTYRGEKFDLIVDDLFFEANGEPQRAIEADASWLKALLHCLQPRGLLVMNFVDKKDFKRTASLKAPWRSVFALTLPAYENCVGVFSRRQCDGGDIRRRLELLSKTDKRLGYHSLRFRLQQVV